jgi:hypothetical protein
MLPFVMAGQEHVEVFAHIDDGGVSSWVVVRQNIVRV